MKQRLLSHETSQDFNVRTSIAKDRQFDRSYLAQTTFFSAGQRDDRNPDFRFASIPPLSPGKLQKLELIQYFIRRDVDARECAENRSRTPPRRDRPPDRRKPARCQAGAGSDTRTVAHHRCPDRRTGQQRAECELERKQPLLKKRRKNFCYSGPVAVKPARPKDNKVFLFFF